VHLDARLERQCSIGGGRRTGAIVEGFNVMNDAAGFIGSERGKVEIGS
jgi:hypothetical protein